MTHTTRELSECSRHAAVSRRRPAGPVLAALALLAATAGGCATETQSVGLDQALSPLIAPGAEPVRRDVAWYAGEARVPEAIEHPGVALIESPSEFLRLWTNQCKGPVPRVDFSRDAVVSVFLTRSAATSVSFHRLLYNRDEEAYDAYFIGRVGPLTQVRYNYPYCVAVLPVRAETVRVHMIHVRDLPDGGWEVQRHGPVRSMQRSR